MILRRKYSGWRMRKIMKNNAKKWKHLPLRIAGRRLLMRFLIYLKEEIRKRLTAGKFPAYLSFTLMKESVNPQKLWGLTIQNLVRDTRGQKQLLKSKEMVRTYAFLPFLSFPSPIRSRASYGGNPVFGRFLTPWIPVPRLREDKLHGNDTDCVSPNGYEFDERLNQEKLKVFLRPRNTSLPPEGGKSGGSGKGVGKILVPPWRRAVSE